MSRIELVDLFCRRFAEQGGVVEPVHDWGEAVDRILDEAKDAAGAVAVSSCEDRYLESLKTRLGDGDRLVGPRARPEQIAQCVLGITFPVAGIAETGSILELCYDDSDRLVSALPPIHLAYLESSKIVAHLLDVAELVRRSASSRAFSATFISGPSRTADIELRQVIGVHGPHAVKILLKV
ncbi:MAG: LUD domain-containing protein [Nitrososphaerota archaeon]